MFSYHRGSPMIEHASILIHCSAEAVFHFISEQFFANYPRWSPGVMELQPLESGPLQEGAQVRQVRVDVGHRTETTLCGNPSRRQTAHVLRGDFPGFPLRLRDSGNPFVICYVDPFHF